MALLAEQLRRAGVACFPCGARYDHNKRKWLKWPSVPEGRSWLEQASWPVDDPSQDWSSGIVGCPVPSGVLVLDVDSYHDTSLEDIEQLLGCAIPWADAHIQNTIGGGMHFAFRVDWDARQGDSIEGLKGFDTRAALRGFICSGSGYSPVQHGGVFAFADPSALPVMPDAARAVLERREAPARPTPSTRTDADLEEIVEALHHVDPGCSRETWRNIGYALKAMLNDDGADVFEAWSSGAYWHEGTPANYVGTGKGSVSDQWPTFNADGGVGPSTLYWHAMRGGWRPPARLNVQGAFGPDAAPTDVFVEMVRRVRSEGCDTIKVPELVDAIGSSGFNGLQIALLHAELQTELTGAGVKIDLGKAVKQPDGHPRGMYGKNDTENADLFTSRHYPGRQMARCDGQYFHFNGKAWQEVTSDRLKSQVYQDMASSFPSESRCAACYRMVTNKTLNYDGTLGQIPAHLVLFDNGVLDIMTGQLHPHDPGLFTTNILPYDWSPGAQCPQWLAFVHDVFDGDPERIALLQEWLGYMLTSDYRHQKVMFLLGGPRCGKGTIGRVLHHLVGPSNFSASSLSSLSKDSHIDTLQKCTVAFIGDAEKRLPPATVNSTIERIKSISGNDAISWHRMYHGGVSAALPTRFTIAANHVPALFDDSGALASRLLLLTFDKSYLGREDLTLGDRLLTEVAGIAAWAVEGWHRLQAQGRFTTPVASAEEAQLIRETYSPLLRFVADCCTVTPGGYASAGELFDTYRQWAMSQGEDLLRPKVLEANLRDAMRGRGVKAERGGFRGLQVADLLGDNVVKWPGLVGPK